MSMDAVFCDLKLDFGTKICYNGARSSLLHAPYFYGLRGACLEWSSLL